MDSLGYSRTIPVTLIWCTGYLDTGVHRLCMDSLGYSWTVPVTLVHGILRYCRLCMDGLGYSRTVPVTLVHGILRHRIVYGRSRIFQDYPSNFDTRDT